MKRVLGLFIVLTTVVVWFSASAQASVLYYNPFNDLSDWTITGAGSASANTIVSDNPSPDGGSYLKMNVAAFNQDRLNYLGFSLSDQFDNFVVSFYGWGNSVLDNTQQTSNTGIDFSEFRWRESGTSAWNRFNIGNSSGWNAYNLNLPNSVAGKNIDFGFRALNAGFGYDTLRVDGLRITGQPVVPEPASMALLGAGLLGLAGMNRRKKI